jgi:hypothetical protein
MNGVIMVSTVFELQHLCLVRDDISFSPFPAYASTAWYHNKVKIKRNLESFLRKVECCGVSLKTNAAALFKGDQLNLTEKNLLLKRLADFQV